MRSLTTARTGAPGSGSSCRSSGADGSDDEDAHIVLKRSSHRPFCMLACEKLTERWDVMDITRRIALVSVAAMALGGGAGAATALAASHGPARANQTSARTGAAHAKGSAKGEDNGDGEHGNDGPGGHADPPGNVDHQFNGEE